MGEINVDLNKSEEEQLREIAEKKKATTNDVIKAIIKDALGKKEDDFGKHVKVLKDLSGIKGDGEDMMDKLMTMFFMKEMMGGKKDDTSEMMKYAMLKQMLSTPQDPVISKILEKAMENKSGNDDILKMYLQQQLQSQQMLMQMMFNNKITEQQKSHEELKKEMFDRFQELENILYQLSQTNQQAPPSLVGELEKYKKIRQSLMDMAEDLGIKKTEITTPEGKVNWGGIAEKFLGIAGKAIDKFGSMGRPSINLPPTPTPELNYQPEPTPAVNRGIELKPKIEEVSGNAVPNTQDVNQLLSNTQPKPSETGNFNQPQPVGSNSEILPSQQPTDQVNGTNSPEIELGDNKVVYGKPKNDT